MSGARRAVTEVTRVPELKLVSIEVLGSSPRRTYTRAASSQRRP